MVCLGSLKLVTAWDSALLRALLPDSLPYCRELSWDFSSSSFEVEVVVFSEIVTVFFAVEADVVAEDDTADADTLEEASAAALAATALVASSWRW